MEERFDVYRMRAGGEELVAQSMRIEDACALVNALYARTDERADLILQIRHMEKGGQNRGNFGTD